MQRPPTWQGLWWKELGSTRLSARAEWSGWTALLGAPGQSRQMLHGLDWLGVAANGLAIGTVVENPAFYKPPAASYELDRSPAALGF